MGLIMPSEIMHRRSDPNIKIKHVVLLCGRFVSDLYVKKSLKTSKMIKIVGMIKKYHNHKLQTYPWHREEEPHNNHETPGRQTK